MVKKLIPLAMLVLGSFIVGAAPAQAQTTVSVTLMLFKGNVLMKSHAMTSVEWEANQVRIYGAKEANGANRYYCVLRSTKQDVLLAIYRQLTDPHLTTKAVCTAPAVYNSYSISVDLENQTTTQFGLSGKR